jgi:hypothetical protein
MYSPRWLFFYPGLALFFAGMAGVILLTPGAVTIGSVVFDVHTLLLSGTAMIIGSQILIFAFLAKQYCVTHGFHPSDPGMERISRLLTLERLLALGLLITAGGVGGTMWSALIWDKHHFGPLDYETMMRVVVPSSVAVVIGLQVTFGAFLASIIGLSARPESA